MSCEVVKPRKFSKLQKGAKLALASFCFVRKDEAGRQSMPAIHVLEDQAVATVEDILQCWNLSMDQVVSSSKVGAIWEKRSKG